MKKVLVAYFSLTGKTEKMAEFVAEGVRFAGHQATVKKMTDIKSVEMLAGYDGYIFGSPTYFRDLAEPAKTFLFLAKKGGLNGKLGGAFGAYSHDGSAPKIILDTMEHVYNMGVSRLGALNLTEPVIDTTDGMRACQAYGKDFGEQLGT